MCCALGCGFVLARPASESPELVALDDEPELPLELFELLEPELPQAATTTAHTAAMSASRNAPAALPVILCMFKTSRVPLFRPCVFSECDHRTPRSLLPVARRVSARAITSR
jgi:hypothetical protein